MRTEQNTVLNAKTEQSS